MTTKFDDYIGEVDGRAAAAGLDSVARWEAFSAHYAMAREIRDLRKEHKLTQKQLAAKSGIGQSEISRIERGQTNPTAATLAALLAPLGARLSVVPRGERETIESDTSTPQFAPDGWADLAEANESSRDAVLTRLEEEERMAGPEPW